MNRRLKTLWIFPALLLAVFGCAATEETGGNLGKISVAATAAPAKEETGVIDFSEIGSPDEAPAVAMLDTSYRAEKPGENALRAVGEDADYRHVSIQKFGDSDNAGTASDGSNAAVYVNSAELTLSDGTVLSNGTGAEGIAADGSEAKVKMTNAVAATVGTDSASFLLLNGGSAELKNCTVTTEGKGSPCVSVNGRFFAADTKFRSEEDGCLALADGAEAEFQNCELIGQTGFDCLGADSAGSVARLTLSGNLFAVAQGPAIKAGAGTLEILLKGQQLSGDILSDGMLTLGLTEGSVFCGVIHSENTQQISIALDENSIWTVTEETAVGTLTDADATLKNIVSNGFTVYYDSSLEANAWLDEKSFTLTGGGFLVPMI